MATALAAVGTVFWLYTFYTIAQLPPGDGSGFQWLAEIPLTAIMVLFVLPAWLLVGIGRLTRVAVALGFAALVAFAIVWTQLLGEFPRR